MSETKDALRGLEFHLLKMEALVQGIITTCPHNAASLPLLIDLRETLDTFEGAFYTHWHEIHEGLAKI